MNSAATGAPTITGTAQVGETLTAATTGISDDDGLTNAVFAYQWLADDAAIDSATASTHAVAAADVGKALKVRVTFTDDAGNAESLTSAATAAAADRQYPGDGQPRHRRLPVGRPDAHRHHVRYPGRGRHDGRGLRLPMDST